MAYQSYQRLLRVNRSLSKSPSNITSPLKPSAASSRSMFCDLVGSTALADASTPRNCAISCRRISAPAAEVIARYDGHVAQYLGDGLMVYFGWPRAHEDDAVRAIRAGLEVVRGRLKLEASTPIRARVGIHTGLVVVGETGQRRRVDSQGRRRRDAQHRRAAASAG